MGKAYFTPELFSFLKQIKRNNRRPWFLKNRERYEEVARQPGLRFVVDFGFRLKEISPWIVVDSKPHHGSLQRIYRDVRFSPDKRPYKTWLGMTFPHASRTDEVRAVGYYLHLEAEGSFLYGGTWQPDRRSLAKIRDAIAWQPEEWKKAKRTLTLEGRPAHARAARLSGNSSDDRRPQVGRFRNQCGIFSAAGVRARLPARRNRRREEIGAAASVSGAGTRAAVLDQSLVIGRRLSEAALGRRLSETSRFERSMRQVRPPGSY